jgi:lipopolysaccharide export system permease protein
MTFFVVLFLLLMQFLWRYIDELVGKGLEFKIIGELLVYAGSGLVPLALPLAILLSSLMTFGNMGEFYELTAMKSSGISLRRIMLPLIILVIIISFGAFIFANNVLPVTNLKMKSLLYDVRNQRPEVQITEGVFYNGIDNYSMRVNRRDPVTNMLYDIKIYDHSAHKGNVSVTLADSGRMKMTADKRNLVITLWSGYSYSELEEKHQRQNKNYPLRMDKFGEQRIIIAMSGFELLRSDESIFRNSYTMLNLSQLQHACDSLQKQLDNKSRSFYQNMIKSNYFKMNSKRARNIARQPAFANSHPAPPSLKYNTVPLAADITDNRLPTVPRTPPAYKKLPARELKPADRSISVLNADSVIPPKKVLIMHNFDSVFTSLSPEKKSEILKLALNYNSMNQYLIISTASNIIFDMRYLRRHEIEWHRKFTLSLACLIFLFIGAPLGAIIRKGGLGMPTVISTLLFILYYIISLTGEKFVRESVLTAVAGMWISSYVLIIAGIFLTYEATNDSAILNLDSYIGWMRDKLGLRKGVLLERKAHLTGKFEILEIPRKELQDEFEDIGNQAGHCLELLSLEVTLGSLFKKVLSNTGYTFLIEFGINYNSLIDRIVLSKWFRIPYFRKRISEFPFLNGRLTGKTISNRIFKLVSFIFFPVWVFILFHLWLKIQRLKRNLHQVCELSAGIINLLNSASYKTDPYLV